MTLVTEIRRSVTDRTPVLALVGATDLVVEKVRNTQAQAAKVRSELAHVALDPRTLQDKAEEAYGDLASRGEKLVSRIRRQKATEDLLAQGKITVSRGKAAVTTARKAAVGTRTAARATVTNAKRESGDVVADTRKSVATRTTGTKSAAKRTATTARKRTATAKSTAKATRTSARKTAAAAAKATQVAAGKVGD